MTGIGLGGVDGRSGISSLEMSSVSGMYESVPDGGALAGSVRAVKPGRAPASAPPWADGEGMSGAVSDE